MRTVITGDITKEDRNEIVESICDDLGLDFKQVKKTFYRFGSINDTELLKFAKDNSIEITFDYPENQVVVKYEHEDREIDIDEDMPGEFVKTNTPVDEDQGEELPDDW